MNGSRRWCRGAGGKIKISRDIMCFGMKLFAPVRVSTNRNSSWFLETRTLADRSQTAEIGLYEPYHNINRELTN